jgi:transposase
MDILSLHRQGHSMRFIAVKLGLHRNTVKKYILGRRFPEYRRTERRVSILAPFARMIHDWLSQDNYRASWVWERLKSLGYTGSYETVKRLVRPIKQQQARLAYIRFETMPGMQAQVDWADFQISEPDGRTRTVYLFILVLGYCRALYAEFVRRCTLESFLDGHIHAFRYLGGVASELLYDNMKHVVIRHLVGKVRFNAELVHFAHHYGFAPKACPPYAAWVKGKVERPVDYVRESFWRGYLPIDSREAYLFFQFVSHRYERSSTIITSNKSFTDWQEHFRGCGDSHRHPRPTAASLQGRQHQGPQLPAPAARLLHPEPGISKSKGPGQLHNLTQPRLRGGTLFY